MNTKSIDLQVKAAPGDIPGIIAYASTFDRIPDAYGDVIAPGAFKGTLERLEASGNALPLLYGHVMDNPANIIGTVTKAAEDEHGLLIEAAFDMENPNAQHVRRAVLGKAISKLSFAFTILDQHTIDLDGYGEVNELTELEIYEVSLVVVPANPRAQVIGAKASEQASGPEAAVDTGETEPEAVKAEEPEGVKAEEPEEKAEPEPQPEPQETKGFQEMEIKELEAIGQAQPAEKGLREILTQTFTGKGLKDGGRFSIATPEIKAFVGTPQWMPTVSRNVAGIGPDPSLADLFGQETITGNAYTFVRIGTADPAEEVDEGGEKPDITPETDVVTLPLTKIAGYIQESDELLEDADWLVSAIENRGVRAVRAARDGYALATLGTDPGVQSSNGSVDEAGILQAIADVKSVTGFDADAIILDPSDWVTMVTDSLANPRTLLGPDYKTFLGVPIYTAALGSGKAIVGAFKDGATLVQKGGVRVEASNSDQDDFIHNLVKIRIEQRLALAIREPQAFVIFSGGGN